MRGDNDSTPLQFACWGGNLELVQYLAEELKCNVGKLLVITTCDQHQYMDNYEHIYKCLYFVIMMPKMYTTCF